MIRCLLLSTPFPTRRSSDLYFCTGTDRFRWGGVRICENTPVRMERLDTVLWEDVTALLSDPGRIRSEFERQRDQTPAPEPRRDRKSTRLNSSHANISYAVFC